MQGMLLSSVLCVYPHTFFMPKINFLFCRFLLIFFMLLYILSSLLFFLMLFHVLSQRLEQLKFSETVFSF